MKNSKIEWCEHTFNPWWGCTKVSPGCTNCYAEAFSKRTGFKIWGQDFERRFFGDKHWAEPLKWDTEARKLGVMHRVFCGSMCDVLEDRPELIDARMTVFDIAQATPNLLWLFLSKRPENAIRMYPARWQVRWPRNVMAGFTIEDQERLNVRMPIIREFKRAFLGVSVFASCEPLLSALDWEHHNASWLDELNWIVAGGESGPHARPCHPEWARKLRNDCELRTDMGRPWPLPFLWKQWGEWVSLGPQNNAAGIATGGIVARREDWDDATVLQYGPLWRKRVGKKAAGRLLDGKEHNGIPMLPYGPQLPGLENYGAVEVSA